MMLAIKLIMVISGYVVNKINKTQQKQVMFWKYFFGNILFRSLAVLKKYLSIENFVFVFILTRLLIKL